MFLYDPEQESLVRHCPHCFHCVPSFWWQQLALIFFPVKVFSSSLLSRFLYSLYTRPKYFLTIQSITKFYSAFNFCHFTFHHLHYFRFFIFRLGKSNFPHSFSSILLVKKLYKLNIILHTWLQMNLELASAIYILPLFHSNTYRLFVMPCYEHHQILIWSNVDLCIEKFTLKKYSSQEK
jgi:hypothetical protein